MGNEAFVLTHDDEVYAIGSNGAGCHGVGDMLSSLQPRKLESLSQKNVISLAYGSGPHVLALCKSGEVYTWGHNGYCNKLMLYLKFFSIGFVDSLSRSIG